jgi:hypothetical protein
MNNKEQAFDVNNPMNRINSDSKLKITPVAEKSKNNMFSMFGKKDPETAPLADSNSKGGETTPDSTLDATPEATTGSEVKPESEATTEVKPVSTIGPAPETGSGIESGIKPEKGLVEPKPLSNDKVVSTTKPGANAIVQPKK